MIRIPEETFNKVMNVLGQLPYAQVAGLLQEVGNNMEQEDGTDNLPVDDARNSDHDSDSRDNSLHSTDQERSEREGSGLRSVPQRDD